MPASRFLFAAATLAVSAACLSQDKPAPSFTEHVRAMHHADGLLPVDWDAKAGKLFLEVPLTGNAEHTVSPEYLYYDSLPWGMGSNDVGLDRGQTSQARVVRFERVGPKVLLVERNQKFRGGESDAEKAAVEQSFPRSVLAGFKVDSENGNVVLIDATAFVVRDSHRVIDSLGRAKQGKFTLDEMRSTVRLERTKAFPENTELEAELTFVPQDAGARAEFVHDVTPDPTALTVREHQSFLALPGPGFVPRRFSPRAGYFDTGYRDYDVPLGDTMEQQFIERHRLIKKDPNCKDRCVAVKPIHYYVDRGAPEPMRTALVEGARWWDQAFQAAGWAAGTFQVDVLPADADPMDARYNIIQWVHRYTRGWSYGATVSDPRTGEIVKGNVTLGSLRARQDYLIAEGLLAPYADGKAPDAAHDPMLAMVLQRVRQLAAHETGHTLGLAHNFAASAFPHDPKTTVSVMDYPFPWITLDANGVPDLSQAYPAGIGLWDKVAIDFGYREYDRGGKPFEDAAAMNDILAASEKRGLVYITDEDARPFGSAHPFAHLWDNGTDAADELNRVLDVRAAALKRFGMNAIKNGTPVAQLEDTLAPLYLMHRYQTEAAIKMIGGLDYRYNVRGDGQMSPQVVDEKLQAKAVDAVLKTLSPATLTLPVNLFEIFPPRPPGLPRKRESLPSKTGLTFDPVASAEASADLTLQVLLDPARAARIVEYHMFVPHSLSFRVLLESLSKATAERIEGGHSVSSEVERAVEFRALEAMMALAVNPDAWSQVRAIARSHLQDVLKGWTTQPLPTDSAEAIHRTAMIARIEQFNREPERFVPAKPVEAPPGMPIGEDDELGTSDFAH